MKSIAFECPHCRKYSLLSASEGKNYLCPHCTESWGTLKSFQGLFKICPFCQGKQFYVQKDFNQLWGCLIMLIGIGLVPFSYGLSLPVFALMDWLLYKMVKTIVVCYKCGTEFRGFDILEYLKPFMHHIGMKYDKYRK